MLASKIECFESQTNFKASKVNSTANFGFTNRFLHVPSDVLAAKIDFFRDLTNFLATEIDFFAFQTDFFATERTFLAPESNFSRPERDFLMSFDAFHRIRLKI